MDYPGRYTADHRYEYQIDPVFRDGERIGSVIRFDDLPLRVGRDFEFDFPKCAFMDFEDGHAVEELDHMVVKAVADDESGRINTAVYFAPNAKQADVSRWFNRLH